MQTLRKKTSPCKYRNEPGRFFGEGVTFKAKLIGILEVGEARGDRMCQEALQDLKIAIRAAGEHKQRIIIHVTIDGLRLRDEKTNDSLYHHPVHKISFIAQDMTDSRAFGYIFGSPDSGHRFFGIKTDKAASQVVLAMRDLFQVVFELKKKEIELARQHIQSKTIHEPATIIGSAKLSQESYSSHSPYNGSLLVDSNSPYASTSKIRLTHKANSPESVADLVDLEQELSSIQRGITQMERITPNDQPSTQIGEDPFGDSFTHFNSVNIPPPPDTNRSRHSKPLKPPSESTTTSSPIPTSSQSQITSTVTSTNNVLMDPPKPVVVEKYSDAFTDLDPLGTGKSKPYVDKKFFFQELKNPPKKLLKELSSDLGFSAMFSSNTQRLEDSIDNGNSSSKVNDSDGGIDSNRRDVFSSQERSITIDLDKYKTEDPIIGNNKALLVTDNDPFSPRMKKFDPFEDDFDSEVKNMVSSDPFNLSENKLGTDSSGPLHVILPPESSNRNRPRSESPGSINSSIRHRPNVFKQNTVDVISNFGSRTVMSGQMLSQKFSLKDSNSINMRRLQESDSLSETELAPEPPPRPDLSLIVEPPPLPPKKQFSEIIIRSRVSSPPGIGHETIRQDYLSNHKMNRSTEPCIRGDPIPPLPLPSRKVNRTMSSYPGPERPVKKTFSEDDYLTPLSGTQNNDDVPILLPPPQHSRSSSKRNAGKSLLNANKKSDNNRIQPTSPRKSPILPDITLSDLLTLSIDDLSQKLNVPATQLSTMTIVELTKYLSEYISQSKNEGSANSSLDINSPKPEPAVFKVNFDQISDSATFVAKFDDNFEPLPMFVADFNNMDNEKANDGESIDKYAAFREIINSNTDSNGRDAPQKEILLDTETVSEQIGQNESAQKSIGESKITEAISQAKDRYAALRDIILVQNFFEHPVTINQSSQLLNDNEVEQTIENKENSNKEGNANRFVDEVEPDHSGSSQSSPELRNERMISDEQYEEIESTNDMNSDENVSSRNVSASLFVSGGNETELNELMNRALSNISLCSRDRNSPLSTSKSPVLCLPQQQNASTSPIMLSQSQTHVESSFNLDAKPLVNDMSTSPINLQKPTDMDTNKSKEKSPIETIMLDIDNKDVQLISKLSPQHFAGVEPQNSESWAVFDEPEVKEPEKIDKSPSVKEMHDMGIRESPSSLEDRDNWKSRDEEYGKKWSQQMKGTHMSSSRDLSPWDDDMNTSMEYRRRQRVHEGQSYESEGARRRRPDDRRIKMSTSRSKENFDVPAIDGNNSQGYYAPSGRRRHHSNWSPSTEDEYYERCRSFDRSSYERSTYGPPYEKRDHKSLNNQEMRREYMKSHYEKRKFFMDYNRPDYEYGRYDDEFERGKMRKDDSDEMYDERGRKLEYGDRKSFDGESVESYESMGGRGSANDDGDDMYGSMDSREDFRDRYHMAYRSGASRSHRGRASDEYDMESETESTRRPGSSYSDMRGNTRQYREKPRKGSGSSPWDSEELPPNSATWKRPSSAADAERRRNITQPFTGSDGEKDKRLRRKIRSRGSEDYRGHYATMRHPYYGKGEYFDYEHDPHDYSLPGFRSSIAHRPPRETGRSMIDLDYSEPENFSTRRDLERMQKISKSNKEIYSSNDRSLKLQHSEGSSRFAARQMRQDVECDDMDDVSRNSCGSKCPYEDEQGFESDFSTPASRNDSKLKTFRFSNDFSEKSFPGPPNAIQRGRATGQSVSPSYIQQKLRFDDNVTVSKIESNVAKKETNTDGFDDDDFSKAQFAFETTDQWNDNLPRSNLKLKGNGKPENIRKSDSVNIFAKKVDDPFEDDDFFSSNPAKETKTREWEKNFAKFDD